VLRDELLQDVAHDAACVDRRLGRGALAPLDERDVQRVTWARRELFAGLASCEPWP
jgi:hypothetical protein